MTTGQEGLIQIYAKQLRLPTVADFATIAREATQHHWGYEEFLREEKQPVLMFGNPGTGKTHLAIGLGYQACCLGYSVRFCTAGQLVTDLAEASQQGRLSSLQARLLKADLLVIDELSYLSFGRSSAELLFQVLSNRYERGSVLITTNLPFSRWTELFGDPTLTAALVDRLAHRAILLDMNGDSYRLKQTQGWRKEG